MAYSGFSLEELKTKFQLQISEELNLFQEVTLVLPDEIQNGPQGKQQKALYQAYQTQQCLQKRKLPHSINNIRNKPDRISHGKRLKKFISRPKANPGL